MFQRLCVICKTQARFNDEFRDAAEELYAVTLLEFSDLMNQKYLREVPVDESISIHRIHMAFAKAYALEGLDEMDLSLYPFSSLESGDQDAICRDVAAMLNTHKILNHILAGSLARKRLTDRVRAHVRSHAVLSALGLVPSTNQVENRAHAPEHPVQAVPHI